MVNNLKAEEILDKYLKCDTYPVWENGKVVKYIHEDNCVKCSIEDKVLEAMEEYKRSNDERNNNIQTEQG